ncbi:MAG TPA: acetyl-CoA C-acetyltransferase, partial [Euzebya sp.]|nr:acetyl-CoA C-acetyltransferase [Euzebya sp.]
MNDVYIYDALRTPRGRGKASGSLHTTKPITLLTGLLHALEARNPDLDPAAIDDVITGVVSPVGDQGMDLARTAVIAAGWPEPVAGVQLNRFCASGLEAVNQGAARVRSGWEDLILAGGVESMSRVPMGSDGGPYAMDPITNYDGYFVPQGIGADLIATIEGFSRTDVDAFALESQVRAAKAQANGHFDKSLVPVTDQNGLVILDRDEHVRPDTPMEALGQLSPSFEGQAAMGGFDEVALQRYPHVERINYVHHAGNSSGIVDGAALMLLGSEEAGRAHGLTARARIVSAAVIGSEPTIMLTGPAPASRKALGKAGMTPADIDLMEINEAFAAVALKTMRDLGIGHDRTNVNGGA